MNEAFSSQSTGESIEAMFAPMDKDYLLKKDAQQKMAKNISRISPASSLTFGGMSLARTGTDEYDRFLAATKTYRWIYRNWNPTGGPVGGFPGAPAGMFIASGTSRTSPIDANVIANIPQFQFDPERLGESLARTLPDFALMALMTIVFLTGAYFAFLRYDVR